MKNFQIKTFFVLCLCLNSLNSYCQVWDSLASNLYGAVGHFDVYNDKLIISMYDTIGPIDLPGVAVWDGDTLTKLDGGVLGVIASSCEYNGNIYLGGGFSYVGGATFPAPRADNLTYWDGTQYQLTDYHYQGAIVNALCAYNNELYLGANHFPINGIYYDGIAKFDGTNWSDVDGGVTGNFREVYCMTVYNGELIVGGKFDVAGATAANNIARWNGTQWDSMSVGLNYVVRTLFVDSTTNILYAGGSFTASGTTPLNFVAHWDGANWQPMGNGLGTAVRSIKKYNGQIYAGTSRSSNPSSLMKFDGANWQPVLPPLNHVVYCVGVYKGDLYASGSFDTINGQPSAGIAKYTDTTLTTLPSINVNKDLTIYPNPASDELVILKESNCDETGFYSIRDMLGNEVFQYEFSGCLKKQTIRLPTNIKSGIYTLCVCLNSKIITKKVVVSRNGF